MKKTKGLKPRYKQERVIHGHGPHKLLRLEMLKIKKKVEEEEKG